MRPPITHPLAIDMVEAFVLRKAAHTAVLQAENDHGSLSTEYGEAKNRYDAACNRADEAHYTWSRAGCPPYTDPGQIPAPALGMRVWTETSPFPGKRQTRHEDIEWLKDTDCAWGKGSLPPEADIVLITDYREGERTLWKRPPSNPETPQ